MKQAWKALALALLTAGVAAHAQVLGAIHAATSTVSIASLPSAPSSQMRGMLGSMTTRAYASTLPTQPLPTVVSNGVTITNPTTLIIFANYADAARAEYSALTGSSLPARGDVMPGANYTLHMGTINATVGMGGGDVALQQPGLIGLAQAAAVAEASLDISDANHRFGVRVQGRSISTQPLFLPSANLSQMKLILTAKPLLTAYWHF